MKKNIEKPLCKNIDISELPETHAVFGKKSGEKGGDGTGSD